MEAAFVELPMTGRECYNEIRKGLKGTVGLPISRSRILVRE